MISRTVLFKQKKNEVNEVFVYAANPISNFDKDDTEYTATLKVIEAIFNITICGICAGMVMGYWENGEACKIPINLWLLVYSGYSFLMFLMALVMIWIYKTRNEDESLKMKFDTVDMCVFTNFRLAWLLYGNTFHYSDAGFQCRDATRESKLWLLMMLIIAWGYLLFIYVIILSFILIYHMCFACFDPENGNLAKVFVADELETDTNTHPTATQSNQPDQNNKSK